MNNKLGVPLDWYRVFCTAAKAGNLTQASESLFISQPAVSMTIKQLEERLGHPLFVRSARGVNLTAEGQVLYSYAEKALGLIDAGERKYLEMTQLEVGSIAIGAGDTLCGQYLLSYLEKYNRLYPHISLQVTNRTSIETLELLKSGNVDFGFVNLPVKQDSSMETTQCLQIQDCLIGGSKYASEAQEGLSLSLLANYPLLMLEKTSNSRTYLDDYTSGQGIQLNPIIELGSSDLLIKFAKINLGLAFVVREFAEEHIDGKVLWEIPLTPPPPSRAVGLVKMKNIPLSYAAQRFVEMVLNKKEEAG
jgi:DNA-binding transcriptional LysR family regulator